MTCQQEVNFIVVCAAFYVKYSQRIGQRYLVYTKDLYKDTDILCLPIYLYPFV